MKRDRLPPEIEETAARWVARADAGLSPAEEAELGRWRAADARHARALERHRRAFQLFDRPRQRGLAGDLDRELTRRDRRRRFAGLAAAVAVLAVVVWLWRPPVSPPPTAPGSAVVLAPPKRLLPDGSVVELRPGAAIAVDFAGPLRRVALRRGEAHFQVAKDPARPFVVSAGAVRVRAVGTRFSVDLGARAVEVLVTEGRVAVDRPAAAPPAFLPGVSPPLAVVDAGQQVVVELAPGAPPPAVQAFGPDEAATRLAWRAPRLEFSGTPLADAVALLNRYNGVNLVIGDPTLAPIELSGYFRADNTEAFLRVLQSSFGIASERVGDTVTLRRAGSVQRDASGAR
jgi:transmembrane sensor